MKVLHIIPTLKSGGAEKMLVDIVEVMKSSKVHVEVLVLSHEGDFYSEKIRQLNVPVHFGKVQKVYHLSHIQTVRSFMNKDFDVIHTHLFASQLYAALAKKTMIQKPKLITTEHSTNNRRREKKAFQLLDKWMYNQYDKIIAITDATKREINNYLPSTIQKTVVVENGIKLERYSQAVPLEHKQLIKNYKIGDVIVLMVASMRPEKNHEIVIKASKLLPSNYHIVFVGDGERMNFVQAYAAKSGSVNIHFLGRRSDVPEIMKACDVFVLPSYWEGFGLVVVEAMAAGLPVIASDIEGLKEVVGNAGVLIRSEDSNDLVEKILLLSKENNFKESITRKGFMKSKEYSIQENVRKQIEIYKKVCFRK